MEGTGSKQSGFGIVGTLVIIMVTGVIVGTGWMVYQHVKQSATTTDAGSNPGQSTNQQRGNTGNQQTQTAQTNTFRISELGVELTLPDSLKNLKYVTDT